MALFVHRAAVTIGWSIHREIERIVWCRSSRNKEKTALLKFAIVGSLWAILASFHEKLFLSPVQIYRTGYFLFHWIKLIKYIYNVLFVSGTVVEITLGPLPPLLCTCWTYDGFFSLEYPTRAHEPLLSRKPRSRPPILVRASKAGLRYLEPSSWTAIRIILLKWKNKLWKCSKNFTRQRWACQWNCIVSMR